MDVSPQETTKATEGQSSGMAARPLLRRFRGVPAGLEPVEALEEPQKFQTLKIPTDLKDLI